MNLFQTALLPLLLTAIPACRHGAPTHAEPLRESAQATEQAPQRGGQPVKAPSARAARVPGAKHTVSRSTVDFVDNNFNGVEDSIDIFDGTSLDENLNGIPDEAEEPE